MDTISLRGVALVKVMALDCKKVACPLRVGGESLLQVEEFKHLRVLFKSEEKKIAPQ